MQEKCVIPIMLKTKAFEDILRFLSFSNLTVNEHNKKIAENPPCYRVEYNVASCVCSKVDFEVCNFISNVKIAD
jgi:hypothetical protein